MSLPGQLLVDRNCDRLEVHMVLVECFIGAYQGKSSAATKRCSGYDRLEESKTRRRLTTSNYVGSRGVVALWLLLSTSREQIGKRQGRTKIGALDSVGDWLHWREACHRSSPTVSTAGLDVAVWWLVQPHSYVSSYDYQDHVLLSAKAGIGIELLVAYLRTKAQNCSLSQQH